MHGNPVAHYPSVHSCVHLRHCVKVLYVALAGLIMIKFTKAAWMFVAASPWWHSSFDLCLSNIGCHASLEWKKSLVWLKPMISESGLLRWIVGKWWCNIPSQRNSRHCVSLFYHFFLFCIHLIPCLFQTCPPGGEVLWVCSFTVTVWSTWQLHVLNLTKRIEDNCFTQSFIQPHRPHFPRSFRRGDHNTVMIANHGGVFLNRYSGQMEQSNPQMSIMLWLLTLKPTYSIFFFSLVLSPCFLVLKRAEKTTAVQPKMKNRMRPSVGENLPEIRKELTLRMNESRASAFLFFLFVCWVGSGLLPLFCTFRRGHVWRNSHGETGRSPGAGAKWIQMSERVRKVEPSCTVVVFPWSGVQWLLSISFFLAVLLFPLPLSLSQFCPLGLGFTNNCLWQLTMCCFTNTASDVRKMDIKSCYKSV